MKRKLAAVAVVLFLVVDAFLVVLLMRRDQGAEVQGAPVPETTASASSSTAPRPIEPNGAVSLSVSDSGVLARTWRGRCTADGRPRLEVSTDQGTTLREIALPLLDDPNTTDAGEVRTVSTLLAVDARSASEITVVANDDECRARVYETDDAGLNWAEVDGYDDWYVGVSGSELISPTGATEAGCEVIRASSLSERHVKVMCTSGLVRGTDDSGETWVVLGELAGAADAVFRGLRAGFGLVGEPDCAARVMVTGDAGGTWTPAGCAAQEGEPRSIAGTGSRVYVLVGSAIYRSSDQGETWEPAQPDGELN